MQISGYAAPHTVQHFCKLAPLFDGCCFYRSDFVIQGGLQRPDGSAVDNPLKPIPMNETKQGPMISNTRGTAAFGHWDVLRGAGARRFGSRRRRGGDAAAATLGGRVAATPRRQLWVGGLRRHRGGDAARRRRRRGSHRSRTRATRTGL